MEVKSVKYEKTMVLPSENPKIRSMVTEWNVTFSDNVIKKHHIVVLRQAKIVGFGSSTSTYVTDKIPEKANLSASRMHYNNDDKPVVLNDSFGNQLCSYEQKDRVNLGFKIKTEEFDKVSAISEELIEKLGDFLKNHLNTTLGSLRDDPDENGIKIIRSTAEPKGLIRSIGSSLKNRVVASANCNTLCFVIFSAISYSWWLYLQHE